MLTITRRLANTLKTVFRMGLNLSTRGPHPPVCLEFGQCGYRIRCRTAEATAEYCMTDEPLTNRIIAPFSVLSDCGANNDQPLAVEQNSDGIVARWQEAAVPQLRRFDSVELPDDTWPENPKQLLENKSQLLTALRDASQVTDPNSARYSLGCLQLSGEGRIAATDGRSLLTQGGFSFPWEGEVLVPASKLFGSKHLPQHEPVLIGKQDEWLSVRTGSWRFQIKLHQDGRFPRVDDMLRSAESATASFILPLADREFLHSNLAHLPGNEDFNAAVTVDLNGKVAVRAKAAESESVTELILTGATRTGDQVRFQTNRNFLSRAMQLGFDRVHLINPQSPAFCADDKRHYLWALLEPTGALQPTPDAIQIESPGPPLSNFNRVSQAMTRNRMTTKTSTNGSSHANGKRSAATSCNSLVSAAESQEEQVPSESSAIDRAVALRSALRSVASDVGELVRALKREKKQHRADRSTLLSLRQLQAIDG